MTLTATATAVVTGWDKATALGTIGAAIATVGAIAAAFIIGKRDRSSAEATAQADRDAAEQRAEADRAAGRLQLAAEHRLELAVKYVIAVERAFREGAAAISELHAYLHALPAESLPLARAHWLGEDPGSPVRSHNLAKDPGAAIRGEAVALVKSTERKLREGWPLEVRHPTHTVTVERKIRPPDQVG